MRSEQLQQYLTREGLLERFHGLKQLDTGIFQTLFSAEDSLTRAEIAQAVDCERSTAYRGVQPLLQTGSIQKAQVNYDQSGYYHLYKPTDPGQIADDMHCLLNDWYAKMGQLIQEFETRYRSQDPSTPPAESQPTDTTRFSLFSIAVTVGCDCPVSSRGSAVGW